MFGLRIQLYSVIYDSGWVSLEHLLPSWHPYRINNHPARCSLAGGGGLDIAKTPPSSYLFSHITSSLCHYQLILLSACITISLNQYQLIFLSADITISVNYYERRLSVGGWVSQAVEDSISLILHQLCVG